MTRGELYHQDHVVFGKALVEAHDLENTKAKVPRILVSNKLAKEYNAKRYNEKNFLLKDNISDKEDEYCLDYLKLSFQNPDSEIKKRYKKTIASIIDERKKIILEKINDDNLNQLEEDVKILEKWIYFQKYFEKQ